MFQAPHPKMVIIKPDALVEPKETKSKKGDTPDIIAPEVARQKMLKSQNRGIVVMAGSQCTWLKKDDYVVFYRAAGTDLTEDKIDYVLVHEDHCLTTIEKK